MTDKQLAHRSRWQKVALALTAIALTLFGVAAAYTLMFSMHTARTLEVAGTPSAPNVLIATQSSKFKDALVSGLIDRLKQKSMHVRVIDIGTLAGIDESDWDALVIIHTWEMRQPPAAVKTFVDRVQRRERLVVLTTSGAGDFKLQDVDAISAASKMADVSARVNEMAGRIDAILSAGQRNLPK